MRVVVITAMLLLAGCTSMPPVQETIGQLNRHYDGRPTREFFLAYGDPVSKERMEGGDILYRWVSLEPEASIPTPVYHTYHTSHGNFAAPDGTTTISPQPQYCQMQIEADHRDRIRHITIVNDSPGKESNSLCGEVFRQ